MGSHSGPQIKKRPSRSSIYCGFSPMIICVLQLMPCLSKGLNPTTSYLYAYMPAWMMLGKTSGKNPPPLLMSTPYSILVGPLPVSWLPLHACLHRSLTLQLHLCSRGTRLAVNGIDKERWIARDRGGCKVREKVMKVFLQL